MSGAVPGVHAAAAAAACEALLRETESAERAASRGDVDALHGALDARDRLLDALDVTLAAMARAARTDSSARQALAGSWDDLVAGAAAVQRANIAMLRTVQGECARLSAAMHAPDDDPVADAYAARGAAERFPEHFASRA